MPAKVPQNVEREDRIVGPLTLKQLLWVLGGAGVIVGIIRYWTTGYLYAWEALILGLVVGSLTLLFAFFKYNELNFLGLLSSLARFFLSPKQLLWQKLPQEEAEPPLVLPKRAKKTTLKKERVGELKSDLERLSHILDSGGAVTQEEEKEVADRIAALPVKASSAIERKEDLEDIFEKVS